jgi:hypothetical protein
VCVEKERERPLCSKEEGKENRDKRKEKHENQGEEERK